MRLPCDNNYLSLRVEMHILVCMQLNRTFSAERWMRYCMSTTIHFSHVYVCVCVFNCASLGAAPHDERNDNDGSGNDGRAGRIQWRPSDVCLNGSRLPRHDDDIDLHSHDRDGLDRHGCIARVSILLCCTWDRHAGIVSGITKLSVACNWLLLLRWAVTM